MSEENGMKTIDIQRLMQLLPHRYPFLLVDRIIDIDGDVSATGIKNVTVNEPHFPGHFPHAPIMPGVLLAARAIGDRPGLTLGLDSLLFDS